MKKRGKICCLVIFWIICTCITPNVFAFWGNKKPDSSFTFSLKTRPETKSLYKSLDIAFVMVDLARGSRNFVKDVFGINIDPKNSAQILVEVVFDIKETEEGKKIIPIAVVLWQNGKLLVMLSHKSWDNISIMQLDAWLRNFYTKLYWILPTFGEPKLLTRKSFNTKNLSAFLTNHQPEKLKMSVYVKGKVRRYMIPLVIERALSNKIQAPVSLGIKYTKQEFALQDPYTKETLEALYGFKLTQDHDNVFIVWANNQKVRQPLCLVMRDNRNPEEETTFLLSRDVAVTLLPDTSDEAYAADISSILFLSNLLAVPSGSLKIQDQWVFDVLQEPKDPYQESIIKLNAIPVDSYFQQLPPAAPLLRFAKKSTPSNRVQQV